jgi:integrase
MSKLDTARLHSPLVVEGGRASVHIGTFYAVAETFLEYQKARLRPLSWRQIARHIRLAKPLYQLPAIEIDQLAITALISEVQAANGNVTANRVRATLSHLFRWSMHGGLVNQNPVHGVRKLKENRRDRVLENYELRAIWKNAGRDHFGTLVKLSLLTGQTMDQIRKLRWSEIKDDRLVVPSIQTKAGLEHVVRLSRPSLEVLNEAQRVKAESGRTELVFDAGRRAHARAKARLDYLIAKDLGSGLPQWALRDLRRTALDGMAALGIGPHVIAGALSGLNEANTAGVREAEIYDALERWALRVMSIVREGER